MFTQRDIELESSKGALKESAGSKGDGNVEE